MGKAVAPTKMNWNWGQTRPDQARPGYSKHPVDKYQREAGHVRWGCITYQYRDTSGRVQVL